MKKKLIIISKVLIVILPFCFRRVRFNAPNTEVTIYKNYALDRRLPSFEEYEPVILSEQDDIHELFSHINSLRYRERIFPRYMDIIGYTYMIEWELNTIYIM